MENKTLQERVLNSLCESGETVTVFLKNGVPMEDAVMDFDDAVIVLFMNGKQKMVYKHMISTIVSEPGVI